MAHSTTYPCECCRVSNCCGYGNLPYRVYATLTQGFGGCGAALGTKEMLWDSTQQLWKNDNVHSFGGNVLSMKLRCTSTTGQALGTFQMTYYCNGVSIGTSTSSVAASCAPFSWSGGGSISSVSCCSANPINASVTE